MLSRKIISVFFLNLAIFSFAQCKTIDNKATVDDSSSSSLHTPVGNNTSPIQPIVKDSGTIKLNSDKTMELHLLKNMKVGDPATHFEYVVYETETKRIIKKGTFRGVAIDWNDRTSLKLTPYIGMEQKPVSDNPEDILNKNTHTQLIIINLND